MSVENGGKTDQGQICALILKRGEKIYSSSCLTDSLTTQ